MAAPFQRCLRLKTKEILESVVYTYSRAQLKSVSCSRYGTQSASSNSKIQMENNSTDFKVSPQDHVKHKDSLSEVKKSIWTEPIPEFLRGDHLSDPVKNSEREYFQSMLNPNREAFYEGRLYSREKGIPRQVRAWLTWKININDNAEIMAIFQKKEYESHTADQKYLEERTKAVGRELAVAHFIISRGGAVKFVGKDQWFVRDAKGSCSIPKVYVDNLFVEAIDVTNMKLTYVGFDNLEKLSHLRYLRFNNCPYVDDWCLSRLQRQSHTLEFLDISNCSGITDNGLAALHCLRKLKGLRLSNLPNVKHLGLLTLLLEEQIPDLVILGVTEQEMLLPVWQHRGEQRLVRALLGYVDDDDNDFDKKLKELSNGVDEDDMFRRNVRPVD